MKIKYVRTKVIVDSPSSVSIFYYVEEGLYKIKELSAGFIKITNYHNQRIMIYKI